MPELDGAALLSSEILPDLPLARAWMCARLRGAAPSRVIGAMKVLPRHAFIPPRWRVAYAELALWTGTTWMTPPRTVARVLAALPDLTGKRVVEIGTGTGYQTALLSALGAAVTSFEVIAKCAAQARARIDAAGARNVVVRDKNGLADDAGVCDVVVVNAALQAPPIELLDRLQDGRGVVVAPVLAADGSQRLLRFERRDRTGLRVLDLGACLFPTAVPPKRKEIP